MSMTEVIGRMQGIQSAIAQLSRPVTATPAAAKTENTAASAAFGEALTAALGSESGAASGTLAGLLATGGTTTAGSPQALTGTAGVGSVRGTAGTAAPGAAGGGAANGNDVVAAAKKYLGVPYVWGGTDPASGMDCSGFVQRVFKDLNIELPRVVSDQMQQGTPVASLAEAKPGDLLVSFGGNHISIYLGDGKAIDAPVPGQTIQVRDAWEKYSNLTSIRRIVPAGAGQ
jgi:cell wall-associated NlpC family hydrolase